MSIEEMRRQAHEWLDKLSPEGVVQAYHDVQVAYARFDHNAPEIYAAKADVERIAIMAAARREKDERILGLALEFIWALQGASKKKVNK